jgi:hypothetical protein
MARWRTSPPHLHGDLGRSSDRFGDQIKKPGTYVRNMRDDMSPENKKRIQEAVAKAGDELKEKLQPIAEHVERNAYAHLWRGIKGKFGKSYKDCDDVQAEDILAHIEEMRLKQ